MAVNKGLVTIVAVQIYLICVYIGYRHLVHDSAAKYDVHVAPASTASDSHNKTIDVSAISHFFRGRSLLNPANLAIVMPMVPCQVPRIARNMKTWLDHPPCDHTDLASMAALGRITFFFHIDVPLTSELAGELTELWDSLGDLKKCFAGGFRVYQANLTDSETVYPIGPTHQFYRTFFWMKLQDPPFDHWLQMEPDVLPVRALWAFKALSLTASNLPGCRRWWQLGTHPYYPSPLDIDGSAPVHDFHLNGNGMYCLDSLEHDRYRSKVIAFFRPMGSDAHHGYTDGFDHAMSHYRNYPHNRAYSRAVYSKFRYSPFLLNYGESPYNPEDLTRNFPTAYLVHSKFPLLNEASQYKLRLKWESSHLATIMNTLFIEVLGRSAHPSETSFYTTLIQDASIGVPDLTCILKSLLSSSVSPSIQCGVKGVFTETEWVILGAFLSTLMHIPGPAEMEKSIAFLKLHDESTDKKELLEKELCARVELTHIDPLRMVYSPRCSEYQHIFLQPFLKQCSVVQIHNDGDSLEATCVVDGRSVQVTLDNTRKCLLMTLQQASLVCATPWRQPRLTNRHSLWRRSTTYKEQLTHLYPGTSYAEVINQIRKNLDATLVDAVSPRHRERRSLGPLFSVYFSGGHEIPLQPLFAELHAIVRYSNALHCESTSTLDCATMLPLVRPKQDVAHIVVEPVSQAPVCVISENVDMYNLLAQNPRFMGIDIVVCTEPVSSCIPFLGFNKSIILYVSAFPLETKSVRTSGDTQYLTMHNKAGSEVVAQFVRTLQKSSTHQVIADSTASAHLVQRATGIMPKVIHHWLGQPLSEYFDDSRILANLTSVLLYSPRGGLAYSAEDLAEPLGWPQQMPRRFSLAHPAVAALSAAVQATELPINIVTMEEMYPDVVVPTPAQFRSHPAVIYFPVNFVSDSDFVALYRLNVPIFVPSKEFLSMLSSKHGLGWESSPLGREHFASIPLGLMSIYNSPLFPHVTIFNSFEDLLRLLRSSDLSLTSKLMQSVNAESYKSIFADWKRVLFASLGVASENVALHNLMRRAPTSAVGINNFAHVLKPFEYITQASACPTPPIPPRFPIIRHQLYMNHRSFPVPRPWQLELNGTVAPGCGGEYHYYPGPNEVITVCDGALAKLACPSRCSGYILRTKTKGKLDCNSLPRTSFQPPYPGPFAFFFNEMDANTSALL